MKRFIIIFCLLLPFIFPWGSVSASQRGLNLMIHGFNGSPEKRVDLYSGYYALLIGCSDYYNGWPSLPNPVKDVHEVAGVLRQIGFKVKIIENPNGTQLRHTLNGLAAGPGEDPNRGIFVFFAGHGSTLTRADGSKLGYIVPIDAPDPDKDKTGFMNQAVSMREIEEICTLIRARHVLMTFDSCFSGTIFRSAFSKPSRYIRDQVLEPVRAFIAAGNEKERVPDNSVFKTCLVQGLSNGYADFNRDGYVTGEELGLYLKEEVINYSNGTQHPHYGKIKNPKLDKGDFVFRLASSSAAVIEKPKAALSETILEIKSNVGGAEVFLDGTKLGTAPLTIKRLQPGSHQLTLKANGYETYRKKVTISAGKTTTIQVILEVEAKAALEVTGTPKGAEVSLDGYFAGVIPVKLEGVPTGSHSITVFKEGYEKWTQTLQIEKGIVKRIEMNLNATAPLRTAAPVGFEPATITNSLGMHFVKIPKGSFMMGADISPYMVVDRFGGKEEWYEREHPQHYEVIANPFYMQTTEVTQKQWMQVMGTNPSEFKDCGDNCPVEQVLWDDVLEFVARLNKMEGTEKYRLPTEAEWEYACRAGNTGAFSFGNDARELAGYAWYSDNSRYGPSPVGEKRPNDWGLHDMHGNVWEWCNDWYKSYASGSDNEKNGAHEMEDKASSMPQLPHDFRPSGPEPKPRTVEEAPSILRVIRGGSWNTSAGSCRSAYRGMRDPGSWSYALGFRIVKDP